MGARPLTRLLALLAATMLVLAACGEGTTEEDLEALDELEDPAAAEADSEPVDDPTTESDATDDATEDDATEDDATEDDATEEPADDDPIIIGSIQTETSPFGTFAELSDSAEALFLGRNAEGGINGRQVEFLRCDDEGDASIGEDCARQMVDAGAVAVMGGIAFTSSAILPVLESAGIPYVGGLYLFPDDYTDPNWYAMTNGGGSAAIAGNAWHMLNEGNTRGAIMYADVGAPDNTLREIIEGNDGEITDEIAFPPDAADLTPFVQAVIAGDPDFVSVQTDGPNTVRAVTGLRNAGFEGDIVVLATSADRESLDAMGSAAEGMVVSGFFDDVTASDAPEAVRYRDDMAEHFPTTEASQFAFTGYVAAYVLAEVLEGIDEEITPDSVIDGITSISGIDTYFEPPLDAADASEDFPRNYYFTAKQQTVQDGELVPALDYYFNWETGEILGDWNP